MTIKQFILRRNGCPISNTPMPFLLILTTVFFFSLYFNRPVWTNNRNNRLAMLLKELEIEKCYIEEDPLFQHTINYEICNKKIWKRELHR